jgi:hypothetical protein
VAPLLVTRNLSNPSERETIRRIRAESGNPERTRGMRELFIEELTEVRGGGGPGPGPTTDACCEEGPLDPCCGWWRETLEKLIDP